MEQSFHHRKETIKINLWQISTIILLILLIASIFTSGFRFSSGYKLSDQEAQEKVTNFINQNIPGVTAVVTSTERESGVYKITLSANGQEGESYLSADGKLLFPTALPLDTPLTPPDSGAVGDLPSQPVEVSPANGAVLGKADAKITIIEFSDFQCPFCQRFFQETFPQLKKEYLDTGKVKLVFRHFPLDFHQDAMPAALASECARGQNKFWEYHDKLFENQQALALGNLKQYAADLKLDAKKFNDCLDTGKYEQQVLQDVQDGIAAGVSGTPAFFINGFPLVGAQPFSAFQNVIEQELS